MAYDRELRASADELQALKSQSAASLDQGIEAISKKIGVFLQKQLYIR